MLRFVTLVGLAGLLFIAWSARAQKIVVNEIMYAPASPEPEWIELFNFDSTISIDITKWTVESGTKTTLPAITIQPLGYLILTKDSTTLRARRPGNYVIAQIALPNLRNSGDTIYLKDTNGQLVDSVPYQSSWGGNAGKSLERIDADGASGDRSNWATSKDSSGSTIGQQNSLRPPDYDLDVANVKQVDTTVIVTLQNLGKRAAIANVMLLLKGVDTISKQSASLPSKDSEDIVFHLGENLLGEFQGTVFCNDSLDEDRRNDTLSFVYSMRIPRDSIVINEIMFEPAINSCEWVELYNRSAKSVSLLNTSLEVGQSQARNFTIDSEIVIPAQSYAVIAANSLVYNPYPSLSGQSGIVALQKSSLDLGNDSATVIFESYDSTLVDSVHYLSSWHTTQNPIHTGLSLERVDPSNSANNANNWQSCTNPLGATPLAKNSAKAINDTPANVSTSMQFAPNPFSPDGDGFEDQSILSVNSGDDLDYLMRVRIFDARGAQVRTLADGSSFKVSSEIAFDGKNDRGQTLAPGLYAALIELTSQNPPKVISRTIGVVIAGKRR